MDQRPWEANDAQLIGLAVVVGAVAVALGVWALGVVMLWW